MFRGGGSEMSTGATVFATAPDPIVRDPAICGGEPTIRGTRIPVRSIVVQWKHYKDVERVRQLYPRLNTTLIHVALGYYLANQEEIDRLIEEGEQFASSAD